VEHNAEISYLIGKAIRRGTATYAEIREATGVHGYAYADTVITELNAAGVALLEDNEISITPETNVLMNQLSLAGLISLALALPPVSRVARRLYQNLLRSRARELDLRRLAYLDGDSEWYYLAPAFGRIQRLLRELLDGGQIQFCTNWRGWTELPTACLEQIASHAAFRATILPDLRNQYLGLPSAAALVSWIRSTGQAAPPMTDIISAGLSSSRPELVRQILFRPCASTADGALRNGKDVCFSCAEEVRCYSVDGRISITELLSQYRYTDLDSLLERRHAGQGYQQSVSSDWLIAKFFVPYTLSARAKRFMIDIGILAQSSGVLDKSHGQYCPKRDRWALATYFR
jgi:hypothetical protein